MYHLFKKNIEVEFWYRLKMYDSCALATFFVRKMFEIKETFVAVETKGEYTSSGATIIYLNNKLGKEKTCRVCVDVYENNSGMVFTCKHQCK